MARPWQCPPQHALGRRDEPKSVHWPRSMRQFVAMNRTSDDDPQIHVCPEAVAEQAAFPSLRLDDQLRLGGFGRDVLLDEQQDLFATTSFYELLMGARCRFRLSKLGDFLFQFVYCQMMTLDTLCGETLPSMFPINQTQSQVGWHCFQQRQ